MAKEQRPPASFEQKLPPDFYDVCGPSNNLIESVKSGIYRADIGGDLIYVNQAFVDILGYKSKDEVIGLNLEQRMYVNPKDREVFLTKIREKGYVKNYEIKNIRKDGKVIILEVTSTLVKDGDGNVIGVQGIVDDVTERKMLEDELRTEKLKLEQILSIDEKISSILELNQLVDFIVEKASEILEAEKCSLMFADEDSHELIIKAAKGLREDVIKHVRVKIGEPVAGLVAKEGKPLLVTDIDSSDFLLHKHRSSYKSKSFLSVPINLNNRLVGVVNVTEKKSASGIFSKTDLKILCAIVRQVAVAIENANLYKELNYLSITDSITKLYNHRYFIRTLDHELSRLRRYPAPLCLMMIDVDNFKSYNDVFGHPEGDILLKTIGKVFIKHLREIDIPCRYGGDEFAIILPGIETHQAQKVAAKIEKVLGETLFKGSVTLSIGIAAYTAQTDRYDLVVKADQALYQAKKEGKNRMVIFD